MRVITSQPCISGTHMCSWAKALKTNLAKLASAALREASRYWGWCQAPAPASPGAPSQDDAGPGVAACRMFWESPGEKQTPPMTEQNTALKSMSLSTWASPVAKESKFHLRETQMQGRDSFRPLLVFPPILQSRACLQFKLCHSKYLRACGSHPLTWG